MSDSKLITISEAARRLNVSERTVYRLMKAGKLARQYVNNDVRLMSDNVQEIGREIGTIKNEFYLPEVGQLSDISQIEWQKQIAEKDAQIAQLLRQQREMGQMLERLQEQMYELTRFVLSQARNPPKRGFEWAFWRKKTENENSEQSS